MSTPFPDMELAAGGTILVVKDRTAFEAKYGSLRPAAGHYTGSLANGGERLRLEDAVEQPFLMFDRVTAGILLPMAKAIL